MARSNAQHALEMAVVASADLRPTGRLSYVPSEYAKFRTELASIFLAWLDENDGAGNAGSE